MTEEPSRSGVDLFQPVVTGRMSQAIVDQVRALIRTGELGIGARLPSERDLCERFGVSRVTVREALRILEVNGLIEIRLGARGGAYVTAPTTGRVGEGITDLLRMSGLSAAEVTEARTVVELGVIPLVVARATDEELAGLLALCDEAARARDAETYTVTMSFDFHLQVAAAAHNPAIVMLMHSFREPVLMSLREAQHEGRQGVAEHRAFVEAVRARDPAQAQAIMTDHLQRTAQRVQGA
ncbi:MAG: DNA-binding transcriptional regulator, FadR family [Modestobacter sp.]|nr:DNA-binding transcriptional regulator, FadR family [Modestobacter sp.]